MSAIHTPSDHEVLMQFQLERTKLVSSAPRDEIENAIACASDEEFELLREEIAVRDYAQIGDILIGILNAYFTEEAHRKAEQWADREEAHNLELLPENRADEIRARDR